MRTLELITQPDASTVVQAIAEVLTRRVRERCGVLAGGSVTEGQPVELSIVPDIGTEGYRITDRPGGGVCICGNDERGLLYGTGKYLRTSTYGDGEFWNTRWRGESVPQLQMRGIYFATHFHNFYHDAPIEEVQFYVEDLALWGFNIINVWFDMHHYNGLDDFEAQAMIERLHLILRAANRIGIGASLAFLANEGYANSPVDLRADWTAGHDGYHHPPGGHYHVELCPSKPGAPELILRWVDEKLAAFADIKLDALWIWPYDQGGCTCGDCAPWGTNGFLRMAEPIARRYRAVFPQGKVILSTWYFDRFTDGEWTGLDAAFKQRPDWVDYLMVDDYGDVFPPHPLMYGAPGGLPMVNFPEISMYSCDPWGGYGANPMPDHLQNLWDAAGAHLQGGFPYSEGIYEDISKAICAQYYWQPDKPAWETAREYICYEFGDNVAELVMQALPILERNLPHSRQIQDGDVKLILQKPEQAQAAFDLLWEADAQMTAQARTAWRWRILLLRALIDAELVAHEGTISMRCEDAFGELTAIYHAQAAHHWVAPPTHAMRLAASL